MRILKVPRKELVCNASNHSRSNLEQFNILFACLPTQSALLRHSSKKKKVHVRCHWLHNFYVFHLGGLHKSYLHHLDEEVAFGSFAHVWGGFLRRDIAWWLVLIRLCLFIAPSCRNSMSSGPYYCNRPINFHRPMQGAQKALRLHAAFTASQTRWRPTLLTIRRHAHAPCSAAQNRNTAQQRSEFPIRELYNKNEGKKKKKQAEMKQLFHTLFSTV